MKTYKQILTVSNIQDIGDNHIITKNKEKTIER